MCSTSALLYDFSQSFGSLFPVSSAELLAETHGPRGAAPSKLSVWQLVMARIYHEMARIGNFSASVKEVTRTVVSDSALTQRLQTLGPLFFQAILSEVLRPLAIEEKHPDAFFHGYRLVAVDGVRFNLKNTAANTIRAKKNPCSRGTGEPAFAHLRAVVLVELGHHQPLGASLGWSQEGEQTLYRQLFSHTTLPLRTLLLGDRLYGSPSMIWEIKDQLAATQSAVLMRVRSDLKAKRVTRLSDGSWLVEVKVICPQTKRRLGTLKLREINAVIHYEGSDEPLELRLWTTLFDEVEFPAKDLAEIYATRWEEELFFRELKSHLHRKNNLLDSGTPETAAQEVMAQLLAASLIARQREAVAELAGVAVTRISFAKVYQKSASLFELYATSHDLAPPAFFIAYAQRILEELSTSSLIQQRKGRSCPRTLRQPVKDWPKTKSASSKRIEKTTVISSP